MNNIAEIIEHSQLAPDTNNNDIERLCHEAIEHGFYGVCVPPYFVSKANRLLNDHAVKIITVIGFPMGYSNTASKVEEIKRAIAEGVDELDVVANLSALKSGEWSFVRNDIDSVTRAVHLKGKKIKIIFETGLLTDEELIRLSGICEKIGVDFVKTSTGINSSGATPEIVTKLREILPQKIGIKASGGIKSGAQVSALMKAGASRIGSSASIDLIK